MKKKLTIFSLIIMCVAVLGFSVYKNKPNQSVVASQKQLPSAKVSVNVKDLDDLIVKSPVIVEGKTTSHQETFSYAGVDFIKTTIEVKQVLKGDSVVKNQKIVLLQTKVEEDPVIKTDQHTLLFLEKYNGPVINDAYVAIGMFQGRYDIDDSSNTGNLKSVNNLNKNLAKELESYNLNSITDKINKK